jgi:hypothetical protein
LCISFEDSVSPSPFLSKYFRTIISTARPIPDQVRFHYRFSVA